MNTVSATSGRPGGKRSGPWDCAKPGGRIAVLGPNFRYCHREYFDCCDHRVVLTERSAEEHLYGAGFEIQRVYKRFLPFSFGGRVPTHPALVRAYLHARPAWSLLGKQFLVIAARPARGAVGAQAQ
jgi:hypothetical protein